jgi:hypothetical protein
MKVGTYDEAALCRILIEMSLLDSAYMRSGASDDLLLDTAKRIAWMSKSWRRLWSLILRLTAVRRQNLRQTKKTKSVT